MTAEVFRVQLCGQMARMAATGVVLFGYKELNQRRCQHRNCRHFNDSYSHYHCFFTSYIHFITDIYTLFIVFIVLTIIQFNNIVSGKQGWKKNHYFFNLTNQIFFYLRRSEFFLFKSEFFKFCISLNKTQSFRTDQRKKSKSFI